MRSRTVFASTSSEAKHSMNRWFMIIEQQTGRARVKAPALKASADRVRTISENFKWITWTHVHREHNKTADLLANEAIDSKGAETIAPKTYTTNAKRLQRVQRPRTGRPQRERRRDFSTSLKFFKTFLNRGNVLDFFQNQSMNRWLSTMGSALHDSCVLVLRWHEMPAQRPLQHDD